jgi:hypothetical protein
MLKRLKSIFKGIQSTSNISIPDAFAVYVDQAIYLITNSTGQLEDKQIITLLEAHGIPRSEATELLLFLPIAFCRHLLPVINKASIC